MIAGPLPFASEKLVAGIRQRRRSKLSRQNEEDVSLSSRALLTALGWIGAPVRLEVWGRTKPQCAGTSSRRPPCPARTIGASWRGKIAGSPAKLPKASCSGATSKRLRIAAWGMVLANKLQMGESLGCGAARPGTGGQACLKRMTAAAATA